MWPKNKKWTEKHIRKKRVYLNLCRTKTEVKSIRTRNAAKGRYTTVAKRWKGRERKQGEVVVWKYYNGKSQPMIKWSGGRFFGIYDTLAHITWFLNYGPIPEGKSIRHLDNDPMNCDIKNLALMDPGEIAAQVAEELPDTYVSKNLFLQSL